MQFKILLIASCILITVSTSAQINKGAVLVGGNLSFSRDESDLYEQKANTFTFSPALGKAIKENLIVGVDLTFARSRSERNDNSILTYNFNSYGVGIFARKYAVVAKNFYLFGQGRLATFLEEDELEISNSVQTSRTIGVGLEINPGIAYAITKKLQLEARFPNLFSLGYSSRKSRDELNNDLKTTRGFGVSSFFTDGTPLNIGMRLLLNGKMNN